VEATDAPPEIAGTTEYAAEKQLGQAELAQPTAAARAERPIKFSDLPLAKEAPSPAPSRPAPAAPAASSPAQPARPKQVASPHAPARPKKADDGKVDPDYDFGI
jgi:flagellar protein FliO/FliZ